MLTAQYTDETAEKLATQLLVGADRGTQIAVISAPSVFVQIKRRIVIAQTFKTKVSVLGLI